ncbi:MAG: putative signal transducing protein [Mycobacteriales bacterium]|nr:DUF2007 domain-containing protein [Frankia sp.]
MAWLVVLALCTIGIALALRREPVDDTDAPAGRDVDHDRAREPQWGRDVAADESLVAATRVSSRAEAQLVRGALEAAGIRAMVSSDDAASWEPQLALTNGVRVLVFEGDLDAARAVLDEVATTAATPRPAPE